MTNSNSLGSVGRKIRPFPAVPIVKQGYPLPVPPDLLHIIIYNVLYPCFIDDAQKVPRPGVVSAGPSVSRRLSRFLVPVVDRCRGRRRPAAGRRWCWSSSLFGAGPLVWSGLKH
jgi:hypothetical protein